MARPKKFKKRCSVMGCNHKAVQRYEDEDIDVYFCKLHKPVKIEKKIKGGNITYTMKDMCEITFIDEDKTKK